MLFKVNQRLHGRDDSDVPARLNTVPLLNPATAVMVRDLQLSELDSADPFENPIMAGITNVTNRADPAHPNIVDPADAAHWDDPVTESPKAGTTEVWRIINTTGDAHPIHVHLVQFQILDRQPFDPDQLPNLVFTGPAQPPEDNERSARKDTVLTYPGTVTRIIARFDLPTGALVIPGAKFRYVLHCHIMEHEENEMMRPYRIGPVQPGQQTDDERDPPGPLLYGCSGQSGRKGLADLKSFDGKQPFAENAIRLDIDAESNRSVHRLGH
jgi:spore coat protein A